MKTSRAHGTAVQASTLFRLQTPLPFACVCPGGKQQDVELQEDAAVVARRLPAGGREARAGGAPRRTGGGEPSRAMFTPPQNKCWPHVVVHR